MPLLTQYRIYCIDEGAWRSTWASSPISTCPVDGGHTVNPNSVQVISETTTQLRVDDTADTNFLTTIVATQTSDTSVLIPDGSFTLVGDTTSQTLTNKTITDASNTIEASQLKTSGGSLTLSGVPSGAGEALVSTGVNDASWSGHDSLAGSGSNTHAQIDSHLASTSNPHSVSKTQVGLGNVENTKVNLSAIVAPGSTDDSGAGYAIGSRWVNTSTNLEYVCVDASLGSAIWRETNVSASNVGTAGVGTFKGKVGEVLEFKNINIGSNKVSVSDDVGNDEIDIDVVEGNINHDSLAGTGTNTHAQIDTHLASTINPHSVSKTQVGLGNVENIKVNLFAFTAPGSTDDSGSGYAIGSRWIDIATQIEYVCMDATIGSAVWREITVDANNVGTAGVGVFKGKVGEVLEFKNINIGSSKVSVSDDVGNDEIDIDIVEANVNHNALSNLTVGDVHTQYALLAGRSGGQTIQGGTGVGEILTLESTSSVIKGTVQVSDPLVLTETGTEPSAPLAGTCYMDNGGNTVSGTTELRYYNGSTWIEPRQSIQLITVNSAITGSTPTSIGSSLITNAWKNLALNTNTRTQRVLGPSMWSLTPVPSNSGDITLTCDIAGTYFVQCSISTQHTGADDDTMFGLTMQRNAPTNANERSDVIREDSSDSTLFLNRRAMLYNDKETVFSASDTLQIWALSNDTPGEDITILAIQIMIWRV